jgi:erythromycin esterase-like protein
VSRLQLSMQALCLLISLLFASLSACAEIGQDVSQDEAALSAATKGLCHAQVAMIGEIATHGDGHTLAFKVGLVERLIDKCGFDSIFFEANQDEFLHLDRRLQSRQTVTPDDLLTAVGGLWKFYREFQPLAPFLLQRAKTGRVLLGGLDDQLAQLGQNYANDVMISEFTSLLPLPERQDCTSSFHRRVYFEYPENAPYSKGDQSQLDACLAKVEAASRADSTVVGRAKDERQEMISATQRWVSRDFTPTSESMANRDRSMFQTFEWWRRHHSEKHKVIVWAATVHIAKQGSTNWGDHGGTNFGSFIHRKYGRHARALGFSALEGSFRQGKGKFPAVPIAPADSVEAQTLEGTTASAVYVGSKNLAAMKTRPGAFFYHSYQTLDWSDFLDSVVVFKIEHPPTDTR